MVLSIKCMNNNVAKHQKAMVEIWKQIACEMGEKIGIDLWGFKFNE